MRLMVDVDHLGIDFPHLLVRDRTATVELLTGTVVNRHEFAECKGPRAGWVVEGILWPTN